VRVSLLLASHTDMHMAFASGSDLKLFNGWHTSPGRHPLLLVRKEDDRRL